MQDTMRTTSIVIVLILALPLKNLAQVDATLDSLDRTISNKGYFVQRKLNRIGALKERYEGLEGRKPDGEQRAVLAGLSREYLTFRFDSALRYSGALIRSSYRSGNPDAIALAKTDFANILISAGMFKEAMDTLQSLELQGLNKQARAEIYKVLARGAFDMESFAQSAYYANLHRESGMAYYDSAMACYPPRSVDYLSIEAQKMIKTGKNDSAIVIIEDLINQRDLTNDELAVHYMLLSFVHNITGQPDRALIAMTKASIADIKGAKKEAVALLFVANYLFERGDIMRASKYINVALDDIQFYGSNFRLWQVSQFLPVIKSEHIVTIEEQKKQLWRYTIGLSILSVIIIFSLAVIYRQYYRIGRVKHALEVTNEKLSLINEELTLANRIKEEYVGYYFSVSSQMIEKLEKMKNSIMRRTRKRQYDEIEYDLATINVNHEKQFLYNKFDEIFLKIFPGFISKFNQLLQETHQQVPRKGHLLNTEMRIFALIRLGIKDNEKIARILDYSVNTIYTYKTRIRKMAKEHVEDFEQEVMKIKRYD